MIYRYSRKKWKYFLLITIFWSFFYAFHHTKKLYSAKNVATIVAKTVAAPREGHSGNITCYFHEDGINNLQEFDDLEPIMGTDIFFHDTYCPNNISDIQLFSKQACSIESALLAHPTKYVFLLIPGPIKVNHAFTKNVLVKKLLEYPNFLIRHINFTRYLHNTPFQKLVESKSLYTSKWPVAHASDILRLASLYHFGGVSLDLDVMVLKSFSNKTNFVGVESKDTLGSGIFNLGKDKVGREVAKECANEISSTFNGSLWSYNGAGLITRILQKRCNVTKIADMIDKNCTGFYVHPESSFTPISYEKKNLIFEKGKWEELQPLIDKSYTIRIWNKTSNDYDLNGPDIPYLKLAKKYCPKIFETGELIRNN